MSNGYAARGASPWPVPRHAWKGRGRQESERRQVGEFRHATAARSDIRFGNHEPRKIPVVLSPDEVARFLEAAPGIKYKAAFSVAYGAPVYFCDTRTVRARGWRRR
jgi:hypothetical protein